MAARSGVRDAEVPGQPAQAQPLEPLVREFIRFVLSNEGQQVAVKDGYLPVSQKLVEKELAKLR